MLDFYLDIDDVNYSDQRIEGLEMEEVEWLSKLDIIKKETTGLIKDDGTEVLPYFDDFKLTYVQVQSLYENFKQKKDELLSTPGFKSHTLNKYEKILNIALHHKRGLKAFCD